MEVFDIISGTKNDFIAEVAGVSVFVKREDLLHSTVSGNKFRKLKLNVQAALEQEYEALVTFGGAYSNHIAATAAAGQLAGLPTVGIIRGEELGRNIHTTLKTNPTLNFADSCGMELKFVTRTDYRKKNFDSLLDQMRQKYGRLYILPEGGTNDLAVRGCEEILAPGDAEFDIICCPVGTGGTIAGIINGSFAHQKVLGFPALKGKFLEGEVQKWTAKKNWQLIDAYHFGGYGKVSLELIEFINNFKKEHGIQLEPIYTGKMFFGIFDEIQKGAFPKNTRILAIHTGGLQGLPGMNKKLQNKKLPQIE